MPGCNGFPLKPCALNYNVAQKRDFGCEIGQNYAFGVVVGPLMLLNGFFPNQLQKDKCLIFSTFQQKDENTSKGRIIFPPSTSWSHLSNFLQTLGWSGIEELHVSENPMHPPSSVPRSVAFPRPGTGGAATPDQSFLPLFSHAMTVQHFPFSFPSPLRRLRLPPRLGPRESMLIVRLSATINLQK